MNSQTIPSKSFYLGMDSTHATAEAHLLSAGFDILYLIRDIEESWGDDGGFVISLSSKNNLYYVHVMEVNHLLIEKCHLVNSDECSRLLNNPYLYTIKCYKDFQHKQDALDWILLMCEKMEEIEDLFESCDEAGHDIEDDAAIQRIGKSNVLMMGVIAKSFLEHYKKNLSNVKNMLKMKHKLNLNMYNSVGDKIDFVIKL